MWWAYRIWTPSLCEREMTREGDAPTRSHRSSEDASSWKTIESLGGIYVKTIDEEGKNLKVYSLRATRKPPRKSIQAKVRAEKARAKIERKAEFRAKTEKKLVEKSERKIAHKKANAQKKFESKIQKKKAPPKK
jgi:hypothetical protein